MLQSDSVMVDFNKKRVLNLALSAGAFFVFIATAMTIGVIVFLIYSKEIDQFFYYFGTFVLVVFITSFTFVALFLVMMGTCCVIQFFKSSPGLVLSPNGITDNSTPYSVGFVPWATVEEVRIYERSGYKFLSIVLEDPAEILATGNIVQRLANRLNFKLCGTPINIGTETLEIGFSDLQDVVNEYHSLYKNQAPTGSRG